jgi:hypothetical protein
MISRTCLPSCQACLILRRRLGPIPSTVSSCSERCSMIEEGRNDRLRFALSPDGSAIAAFNTANLRLISTKTGTFLTPATSIASLAHQLRRRVSPAPNNLLGGGRIQEVAFAPDGALLVDAGDTRFKRRPPLSTASVNAVLRKIETYTGISNSDGKPLLDLVEVSQTKTPK